MIVQKYSEDMNKERENDTDTLGCKHVMPITAYCEIEINRLW